MKKKKGCLLAVLVMVVCLLPTNVFAQADIPNITQWMSSNGQRVPLDADGDVIKIGGEGKKDEAWVRDLTSDEIVYYLMDSDYNIKETKSEAEFQPILDKDTTDSATGEIIKTDEGEKTGTLMLEAKLPDELKGKDVIVSIKRTNGESGSYRLYETNNYEATEIVPVGEYTVMDVRINGDMANEHMASYEGTTEVTEDGGAYFNFDFTDNIEMKRPDVDDVQGEEVVEETKGFPLALKIVIGVLGGIGLLVLVAAIQIIRRRRLV